MIELAPPLSHPPLRRAPLALCIQVAAGAVVALQRPELVSWFQGEYVTRTLSLTMLGMGLTTPLSQFRSVVQIPKAVLAGVLLQYTVMPFFG